MSKLKSILLAATCVVALSLGTAKVSAQGGNFDPAQFRQRMVDSYRDRMGITNDDEWKVIGGAISKVIDAQFEARAGALRGFGGGFRPRNNNNGGDNNTNGGDNNRQQRRQFFGGQPSPEADDLQKAIDANAPADEIKSKLARLRDANAATEAKLTAAQEDLKKLLTARQEAVGVLYGLLK